MKLYKVFLSFVSVLILNLSIPAAHAADPIPINPEEDLMVVVYDNVMPRMGDGWTSANRDRDRFLEFKSAMESVIKEQKYEGPVKIYEFAAGLPDISQVLEIYIYRWEQGIETFGPNITVEFTMEVVLKVGKLEFGMGSFTARESHVTMSGPYAEDFRPAAKRAIDQMIEFYRNSISG